MFVTIFSPNFWWMIAGILFVIEIITPSSIFIFPSIAAAITALLAYWIDNSVFLTIIFFILSILLIIFARPLFRSKINNEEFKSGSDALIGERLRVIETIDNNKEMGKVKHASDRFPARSIDNTIIEQGSFVEVVAIDGIKLLVKEG